MTTGVVVVVRSMIQIGISALGSITFAPPVVQHFHIAREYWFAQFGIDRVVLMTHPLTELRARRRGSGGG